MEFDGFGTVDMITPNFYSLRFTGDAIRAHNSNAIAGESSAELKISGGGNIGKGFLVGLHLAGGAGGVRCDGTNIHQNASNMIIDNAAFAEGNREMNMGSTCAMDVSSQGTGGSPAGDNILINDAYESNGSVMLQGWIGGADQGHGLHIEKWNIGFVNVAINRIASSCGSNILIDDATTHVSIPNYVNNQQAGENPTRSAACTTWQAANTGHGYGIEASVVGTQIANASNPYNNAAGAFSPLTGLVVQNSPAGRHRLESPADDRPIKRDDGKQRRADADDGAATDDRQCLFLHAGERDLIRIDCRLVLRRVLIDYGMHTV